MVIKRRSAVVAKNIFSLFSSPAMDLKPMEKVIETTSVDSDAHYHTELYDPSKESIWTRLGVNFESFRRAPNTTGYVLYKARVDYDLFNFYQWSGHYWC